MKDKIIVFVFLTFIATFASLHIVIRDEEISNSERRKLSKFPSFELNSEYITEIDEYLLDHFPFRDTFRSIKAKFNYDVLNKLDNNGIYLKDDYIFKSNYPTNNKSIDNFINKTNKINSLLSSKNNVYMMVVPDKNYYLDDELFLNIDYDYIYNKVSLGFNNIDIRDIMNMSDYYETDTHWRSENLLKVIKRMSENMGFEYKDYDYKINEYDGFYGVYYGESAVNRSPEVIRYLTNDILDNVSVKYLENNKLDKIYNLDNLTSYDSYEVYLDGASAFIEIYNDECENKKELVIFRDSFGSSIAPLLVPYYSKITLIDNRYINSDNFTKYIDFDKQDVLFIYSTLIINDSFSLKG